MEFLVLVVVLTMYNADQSFAQTTDASNDTTDVMTTAVTTYSTPRTSISCRFYQNKNDTCYHLLETPRTWQEAADRCSEKGGHIAVVKESWLHQFLKEILHDRQKDEVWLGANRTVGEWTWTDGTTLQSYTNWFSKQPLDTTGNENCVMAMPGYNYKWVASPCTEEKQYICEIDFTEALCKYANPAVYEPKSEKCLKPFREKLRWVDAKKECENTGSKFGVTNTSDIIQKFSGFPDWQSTGMWIGLRRERWNWQVNATEEAVKTAFWGKSQPSNSFAHCVKMQKYGDGDYYWSNEKCDTKLQAVCQIETSKVLFVPTTAVEEESTTVTDAPTTTVSTTLEVTQVVETGASQGQSAGIAIGVIAALVVIGVVIALVYFNRVYSNKPKVPSMYSNQVLVPNPDQDKSNGHRPLSKAYQNHGTTGSHHRKQGTTTRASVHSNPASAPPHQHMPPSNNQFPPANHHEHYHNLPSTSHQMPSTSSHHQNMVAVGGDHSLNPLGLQTNGMKSSYFRNAPPSMMTGVNGDKTGGIVYPDVNDDIQGLPK